MLSIFFYKDPLSSKIISNSLPYFLLPTLLQPIALTFRSTEFKWSSYRGDRLREKHERNRSR